VGEDYMKLQITEKDEIARVVRGELGKLIALGFGVRDDATSLVLQYFDCYGYQADGEAISREVTCCERGEITVSDLVSRLTDMAVKES
jgi:hypothetical protein